jgi:hypothetical protein
MCFVYSVLSTSVLEEPVPSVFTVKKSGGNLLLPNVSATYHTMWDNIEILIY